MPVRPVHPILKRRYRERMPQILRRIQHHTPIRAVIIARRYHRQFCVHPKHALLQQIQRQTVRPLHIRADDRLAMRAIHTSPFDTRRRSPVRPVHEPIDRIERQRPRNVQRIADQRLAHVPIEVRHLNRATRRVRVVQMIVDPVHRQAIGRHRLIVHHRRA